MELEDIRREDVALMLGVVAGHLPCWRSCTLDLRHKWNPSDRMASRVGCNSWCCPECIDRKRLRIGVHLGWRFLYSRDPVAEEFVPAKGWDRRRKQLQRCGAFYARVSHPAGGWWVFHTADDAPCGAVFADPVEAVVRLGERLRAVRPVKGKRNATPVSTCRTWAMPEGEGEYKRAGLLPVANPQRLRDTLEAGGVKVKNFDRDDRREWAIGYRLEDGAELVCRGGRFEVVVPDVSQSSIWEDYVELREIGTTPVFRVEFGPDGPELSSTSAGVAGAA